ncbi:hypothetical protein PsorP6_016770 [Peronosclerospora sorghi]|uniref:Uncharacterized protein n=1 Tax=Peronosclerospora sorghi TaxID=230839 RepID=A0ACC0WF62_9STRA|nr:hypothetical protein PsorP6_016770 [Peronosclerospora sorghi]
MKTFGFVAAALVLALTSAEEAKTTPAASTGASPAASGANSSTSASPVGASAATNSSAGGSAMSTTAGATDAMDKSSMKETGSQVSESANATDSTSATESTNSTDKESSKKDGSLDHGSKAHGGKSGAASVAVGSVAAVTAVVVTYFLIFFAMGVHRRAVVISLLILLFGLLFGFIFDANAHIPKPWNRVSSILGWIYFFCWSVSFYPQVFLNRQRQSVVGLSLDYTVLNMLGFTCYSIFNVAFYYSDTIQRQYMKRHHGNRNAVELNDVFFSLHATVLVAVSLFQCVIYPRGRQVVSKPTILWTGGTLMVAIIFAITIMVRGNNEDSVLNTLNLLYLLSYVKLVTTLVKCLPQIALNYQRKSTVGWTIWNVLLDTAGGLLSIGQQVLDAAATNDWTAMTGDPVKFALGFVSILVDVVFILQHYVFYAENNYSWLHNETRPVLPK